MRFCEYSIHILRCMHLLHAEFAIVNWFCAPDCLLAGWGEGMRSRWWKGGGSGSGFHCFERWEPLAEGGFLDVVRYVIMATSAARRTVIAALCPLKWLKMKNVILKRSLLFLSARLLYLPLQLKKCYFHITLFLYSYIGKMYCCMPREYYGQ